MRVILTDPFTEQLIAAPPHIQKLFGKQLSLLLRDFRHISLRSKRFDAERFQARINDDWRFYSCGRRHLCALKHYRASEIVLKSPPIKMILL